MRKAILVIMIMLAACSVFAGGSSEKEDGPVTITYYGRPDVELEREIIASFEAENPGIKVNYVELPSSSNDRLKTIQTVLQSQGTEMDVFAGDACWPAIFISAGWVEPLDDYITPEVRGGYIDTMLSAYTVNGRTYGLPFMADVCALYYRDDLLSKYGLPVPQTYDEILEYSIKAVSDGSADSREIIASLSAPGMRSRKIRSSITIYPVHRALHSSGTPSEERWNAIQGIPFQQGNISGTVKLLWNEEYLFYRVLASGPFKPEAPATIDSFFAKDVLEFFLDLSNTKPSQYDPAYCMQLFCCPAGVGNDTNVLCGSVLRARKGDNVEVTGRRREPEWKASVQFPEQGGYLITGAIPWKIIRKNFRPVRGQKIGFDLALSHPGTKQTTTFSASILGLKRKQHWSPKGWGVLILQ